MSSETVIIIVGIVLMAIAFVDSIKSLGLLNAKLRIALGMIGFLMILYCAYMVGATSMPGQIEQVTIGNRLKIEMPVKSTQIVSPIEGDSVDCRIVSIGVYPEGNESDVWVLLKPSDGKYYPQSDDSNTSYKRNGEWQVVTRFGGDNGETYEIIVYESDATASQYFTEVIQKWKEDLSYPGLLDEELPAGAKEVDRISVSLKDNCRGVF